jgi:hypothetical protein
MARGQAAVKTSVMHPLTREDIAIGLVEFAARDRIEPTPASREGIAALAELISRAHQMCAIRKAQRKATGDAMQLLRDALHQQSWRRLALPQLFVAHAGEDRLKGAARAQHLALVTVMREVVDEFAQTVKPVYWSDVTEAGNINEQVLRDIGESEFGLCYLSEPRRGGGFVDNPNGLFEAGMMQALAKSPNALLRAWIPVREKDSPPLPFDIAAERMLVVDRNDGKLDPQAFATALRKRLRSAVDELGRDKRA